MADKRRMNPMMAAALLFILAFVSGCVSPKRLFNLTPLGSSTSRNTVNLWPICYANENGTSVLWPVFDTDAKGFALRPLVFNEGKEWGVLWPISDFDQNYFRLLTMVIARGKGGVIPLFWIDKEHFWQFLLAYKTRDGWGCFPLLCRAEDFSYFLPFYYYYRDKKSLITPLAYFSPTFNCLTFAWWNRANGYWGLFPVCFVGREGHHFLLWWKTSDSTGVFPFYISVKDFTAAGPVWWNRNAWGVFPVCRFGDESSYCLTWWKTPKSTGLFPFYFNVKDFTAAGPVWWDKDAWGLFPLFSYSSTQLTGEVGILSHIIGGCKWGMELGASTRQYSIDWLCYLGKYEVKPLDGSCIQHKFRMWPFFYYASNSPDNSVKDVPGTFRHHAPDEPGGVNMHSEVSVKDAPETFRHNALLGALWNYSSHSRRIWLGEQANECKRLSILIKTAKLAIYRNVADADSASKHEEYRMSINESCQKLGLAQLGQMSHESLDALAKELELKYPKSLIQNRSFGMLLDLVDYRKNGANSSFSLIWGTLFKRKTSPEKNETSVLWRGFRQVTTANQSSREIFPFISYYSNQEEQTTVSAFAWRLFRRETSPDGNKLWLFFIPFQ